MLEATAEGVRLTIGESVAGRMLCGRSTHGTMSPKFMVKQTHLVPPLGLILPHVRARLYPAWAHERHIIEAEAQDLRRYPMCIGSLSGPNAFSVTEPLPFEGGQLLLGEGSRLAVCFSALGEVVSEPPCSFLNPVLLVAVADWGHLRP